MKSHFEIHSRFRNGIFLLSIFLFLILIFFSFRSINEQEQLEIAEVKELSKQAVSLYASNSISKREYKLRPFNPNFLNDYKGYVLGVSSEELDRLYTYRSKNNWLYSISDFQKVTGVSDAVLKNISPFFKFPDWVSKRKTKRKQHKIFRKTFYQKLDLNTVTIQELEKEVNIPGFVAERIVRYRNKIGGFAHDIQLKDVQGLYDYHRKKILSGYTVKKGKQIKKVNINTASINELIAIPYFDFETALEIRDFIKKYGEISDFEELGKIDGFYLEKIDRIALYLTLK